MMSVKQQRWLLLLLFALYYLLPLESRPLWQPDETRYAEISREMLASGNWLIPKFLDLRYFEKPVAGYWINNLGQLLFGSTNFAVRFGVMFSTVLSALGVYWLTRRIWQDSASALMASVIYLTCLLVYGVGTYAVLDPMVTLWMTLAMCSFWLAVSNENSSKRWLGWILLGVSCGTGFMTKGFLALAVPVISVLPWVAVERRWKSVFTWGWLAVFTAILISLPWALAIARAEPDFWHYFFWVEHIQRFAEENAQHKSPFWYYLPVLMAGTLPWLALLPGAVKLGWQGRNNHRAAFYLLSWLIMPLLFFSIAKGKLPTYILPCFAPLAILMAQYARTAFSQGLRVLKINAGINLGFGLLCLLIVVVGLSPWGVATHPLFAHYEIPKVLLASLAFVIWALVGWLCWCAPQQRWQWAAVCPLGLALLVGSAMPQYSSSKMPQPFFTAIHEELANSRYLLADSVGLAAGMAWEMKRSDVLLYDEKGELDYGLNYPDSRHHFISSAAFPDWLAQARTQGSVSLVMLLGRNQDISLLNLPAPDFIWRQERLLLYLYQPQP